MACKVAVEKIGEYKKLMKQFVKGLAKNKMFLDEDSNLNVRITKTFDKGLNYREVVLSIESPITGVCATLTVETPTRVFNKVDPTIFEGLGEQLSKMKNFGKLIVE